MHCHLPRGRKTVREVLDQERDEDSGHQDRCCRCFVAQFSQTRVREHELSVSKQLDAVSHLHLDVVWTKRTYVNECSRHDNARTKLLYNDEDEAIRVEAEELGQDHWAEYS